MIVPVILSGGSGTRLWPLSRDRYPKQLLPLITEHSLLQDTFLRLDAVKVESLAPIVICNESHGFLIQEQLEAIDHAATRLVLEPEGRNTAPAAAVAALLMEQIYPGENPSLLILPADHAISDPEAFADAVAVASGAAELGFLVTFGVVPDRPETGYGYIKRGDAEGNLYAVDRFVEKPDYEHAKSYIHGGDYFWNSGMFMFKAATYLAELESFAPRVLASCRQAVEGSSEQGVCIELGREAFAACPSDSIDYAVMEQTAKAVVMPLEAGWSDVGSWASLHDVCEKDAEGNVSIGNTLTLDSHNSYFRAGDRLVAGVGLEGFIVVDTPDALLVMPKAQAQVVKEIVSQLKAEGCSELNAPAQHRYPWGSREVVDTGERFEVRRMELNPGATIGPQAHHNHAEHWIVVSGTARITTDAEPFLLKEGEAAVIPLGRRYVLENPGRVGLTIIAVLAGAYVGEDDVTELGQS